MTKTLTQDDFKGAPDWVKSAAVDENGTAWRYGVPKCNLIANADTGLHHTYKVTSLSDCEQFGTGYDTTNWQHSAIDRE